MLKTLWFVAFHFQIPQHESPPSKGFYQLQVEHKKSQECPSETEQSTNKKSFVN